MDAEEFTVIRQLKKEMRAELNRLADRVAIGECKTFEEYKFNCGQIQGIAWVERMILDLEELGEKSA